MQLSARGHADVNEQVKLSYERVRADSGRQQVGR